MRQLDLLGEVSARAKSCSAGIDQLADAAKSAIRAARLQGRSYRQLAEEHGTTAETIRAVCRGGFAR